jgi:hypothetical protein
LKLLVAVCHKTVLRFTTQGAIILHLVKATAKSLFVKCESFKYFQPCAVLPFSSTRAMATTPAKWVVIIAIDFYVDPRRRLEGCVNDGEDFHSWLKNNYHPVNVTKLFAVSTDDPAQKTPLGDAVSWPTYENVTGRLKEITKSANPGDFVYVHYSGHGTLRPTTAREYRENDGTDAALVLFDVKNEIRYLKGIELATLLDDMVLKQLKLTVVLDCCHSGSITRNSYAVYVHVRGIPWDPTKTLANPLPALVEAQSLAPAKKGYRNGETDQHWLLRPEGYTLIAGCGPHEIAGECRGEDGRIHGVFSYFLLGVLATALNERLDITYGCIHRQLLAKFHVRLPRQHPILLGNKSAVFMHPRVHQREAHSSCNVVKASGTDQIWLNVGHAHGVCLGDVFVIQSVDFHALENPKDSKDTNKIRIKAVHALQSQAELIASASEGASIRAGWYATLVLRSNPKAQIRLLNGVSKSLQDLIAASMWLQVVEKAQANLTALMLQVEISGRNRYAILDGSGQYIPHLPQVSTSSEHAVRQVVETLEHLTKFASIENLGNLSNLSNNSLSDSDFSIELKAEDDLGQNLVLGNRLNLEEGSKLKVTFRNNTNMPLNFTVLNLRPLRGIKKIYPSIDRGDWKVVQPQSTQGDITFSGVVWFKVKMSIPDIIKAEECSEIEDIFKMFVTTRPTSFAVLELSELPELCEQVSRPSRSPASTTFSAFLHDLTVGRESGHVRRGEPGGSGERWACRNVVVTTKRKGVPENSMEW